MACLSLPSIAFAPKASNLSLDYLNRSSVCLSQIGFGPIKNSRKVRFSVCGALRNIDADDFRHPLDKQNTLIMRAIPGLNEIVKGVLGTIAERFMVLENMGNSVLVSENQLPELYQLMVEAAEILKTEAPDLYVRQSPVPNAYTLAISGKKPFVVVHTSLVELLTRKELQAVLAHELGHLKCDHGVWLTVANTFILGAYMVPGLGGLIAQVLEEQLFLWLRAAELTCDRAALLVAQDPKVVVSVIMKLAGGCPSMADQLNVDAFLEQATSYDKASSSPSGRYIRFRRGLKVSGHHGPPTYPIIGCLISFYKNSHRLLDWYTDLLSESPTQTIVIRRLGARRTIVTANPENVEHVLKTRFSNYPKGKAFTEILGDFLGCGIFNVDGEMWYTQRKLASHEFSARSLQEYIVNTLAEEVESKLLPVMESFAVGGDHQTQKVVDLQELLRGLAFDIICRVSLGIDPHCLDPSLSVSSLASAFNVASAMSAKRALEPVSAIWKVKRMLGLGSERRLKEAIGEIRAFVAKIILDKRKGVLEGEDLLSKMILAGHDEVFLRDMVISFIMAGRDTTSAAMTWLFYMLSQNRDVEREVVRELGFVGEERLSSYETIKEMRYLEACLCESMRLFPPVAWDSKHAIVDDTLPDGTAVRAGDRVTYFPYGMGRMKALWGKDRLEFKPERWLPEPGKEVRGGLKKVWPYKFPVFQAGPRVCLGKEMAVIQMKYVVASILKRFEIRPAGLNSPVFVPMLTAHMAGGFKVFVRRRQEPVIVKN